MVLKLMSKHNFHTNDNNSIKNLGGGTVLVLCMSSDDTLYLYNVP